jgi:hypothetical protein
VVKKEIKEGRKEGRRIRAIKIKKQTKEGNK